MLVEAHMLFWGKGTLCSASESFVITFGVANIMEIVRYISEYGFAWGVG
jgi:hypothetical protein